MSEELFLEMLAVVLIGQGQAGAPLEHFREWPGGGATSNLF